LRPYSEPGGFVVEYALVLVHSSMAGLGLLSQQVNVWIGDINWTLVGYAALCLLAFRIALWAFKIPQ
jgi:hypothetical protein